MKFKDLSYLFRFVKAHGPALLLALLLLAADVYFATMLPWLMSVIVDDGILLGDEAVVEATSVRMAWMALAGSLTAFLSATVIARVTQRISHEMRKQIFQKIHSLSYGQLSQYSSGVLVTRIMSDTQVVCQFVGSFFQVFLKPLALFVMGLVMTLAISRSFALAFAVVLPLQLLIMILFMKRLTPLFLKIQLLIEKINSRIQEALSNLRLIRVYARQAGESQAFGEINGELRDTSLRIQTLLAVMNPLIMLITNLVLMLIIWVGSGLVRSGGTDVGEVIAAIMYIQQIMMSLMMMGQIYQMYSKTVISCQRLEEINQLQPSLRDGTEVLSEPVREIRLDCVSYRYPGTPEDHPPALSSFSQTVPRGAFYAVAGPTGSGKSTLAALLSRLVAASAGTVSVNGRDILDYTESSLRSRICVVLQKNVIASGTIADNIRYGLESASPEEIRQAAVIAQADSFISALPQGYDTPVSQRGSSLSGGQKQSLALARALLRKPEVLILDDSTSALDLDTERRFREALRAAYPEMTLIMISQRIAPIIHADHILLLDHGVLSAEGTHSELLAESRLYREICKAQNVLEETP